MDDALKERGDSSQHAIRQQRDQTMNSCKWPSMVYWQELFWWIWIHLFTEMQITFAESMLISQRFDALRNVIAQEEATLARRKDELRSLRDKDTSNMTPEELQDYSLEFIQFLKLFGVYFSRILDWERISENVWELFSYRAASDCFIAKNRSESDACHKIN